MNKYLMISPHIKTLELILAMVTKCHLHLVLYSQNNILFLPFIPNHKMNKYLIISPHIKKNALYQKPDNG